MNTIKALYEQFRRTRNVNDDCAGNVGCLRSAVTHENVEIVYQVIQECSRVSFRRVAAQAGIQRMSAHHIMRHSLHLFVYKIPT